MKTAKQEDVGMPALLGDVGMASRLSVRSTNPKGDDWLGVNFLFLKRMGDAAARFFLLTFRNKVNTWN